MNEAREQQIAKAQSQTAGVNERYFARQEELERQAAENKPVLLPKQTIEDAIAAAKAAYSYKHYDPNAIDPLLEKEPEYVQRQFNYTPLAKRPKVKVEIVKAPAPQNDPLKPQKAQSEVEPS